MSEFVAVSPLPDGRSWLDEETRRHAMRMLRERQLGLMASLEKLLARQAEVLGGELGLQPWMVERITAMQQDVLEVLADRYDALDDSVRESEIPFVELCGGGQIAYANASFGALVGNEADAPFADLFGARSADVRAALAAGVNRSLRVDIGSAGARRQVRLEIGPLRDERGAPGNFALLLDQSAERSRLNALQDGVIRTDLAGRIQFANERATEIFGFSEAELAQLTLAEILGDGATGRMSEWLAQASGFFDLVPLRTRDLPALPARVSGAPYMEAADRCSGLLLLFVPLAEDLARQEIRTALIERDDPQAVIREAIRAVAQVIPFEMATFGIYDDREQYWRALCVEPAPQDWEWSTRWFRVQRPVLDWLAQGQTWTNDVRKFMKEKNNDEADNPVTKAIIERKLTRMLVLPIREVGGRFRGTLTLLAKTHEYSDADLRKLQNLGIEEVLQAADFAQVRARAAAERKLNADLNDAPSPRILAERLAKGTAACFGWQYVGVFRVDRATSEFVLLAQHADNADLRVREDYRQKFKDGMLGQCLVRNSILVVPDVDDPDANYGFMRTSRSQRSAITVPLYVNGRIELIIDIESTERNAFSGPEREAARGLAANCERVLAARSEKATSRTLMNKVEQAGVIVDAAGTITTMNGSAETIFGQALGAELARFAASDDDVAKLKQTDIQRRIRIDLSVAAGTDLPAVPLATVADCNPLFDDYNHTLWLFTPVTELQRERDWAYLEETVTAVARQTRAPLLIADGLLRGARALLPSLNEKCAELLDHASNQLLKADLTFERLADRLAVQQAPVGAPTPFDPVGVLFGEIESLPDDDRAVIDAVVETTSDVTYVSTGWPERLAFAFRSALGSVLLWRAQPADRVTVTVSEPRPGWLSVNIDLPGGPEAPLAAEAANLIEQSRARAWQMASVAADAIGAALAQHSGSFEQQGRAFIIEIPAKRLETAP